MKLFKFFVVGIVFGIVLTKAEAISWYRIYEMFQFQSFHMYRNYWYCHFVGVTGIYLIKKKRLKILKGLLSKLWIKIVFF